MGLNLDGFLNKVNNKQGNPSPPPAPAPKSAKGLSSLDTLLTNVNQQAKERDQQLAYQNNPYNKNLMPTPQPLIPLIQPKPPSKPSAKGGSSLWDGLKHVGLEALDLINRPENALFTGIDQKMHGGSFLQGAKEGITGQTHTSGMQINKDFGFTDNMAKFLERGLIADPTGKGLAAPILTEKQKAEVGHQLAGAATETFLDPLNLLAAEKIPKLATTLRPMDELKPNPSVLEQLTPKPNGSLGDSKSNPLFDQLIQNSTRTKAEVPPEGLINRTPIAPKIEPPTVDTSAIDNQINTLTHQLNNQPRSISKSEIDSQLQSLDINDAYLNTSRRNKTISEEEYRKKMDINDQKRAALVEQSKPFTTQIPNELNYQWNNQTRGYELGDYTAKQAYGGGYVVQKAGKTVQKFRTQDEATKFMQETVAKEKGIQANLYPEGVLHWKSTYDGANKTWDIQSGEYSIIKNGNDHWTVTHKNQVLGTFKNEKKAREIAQKHYDSNAPVNNEATKQLENQINTLHQQREALMNKPVEVPQPKINEPVKVQQPKVEPIDKTTQEFQNEYKNAVKQQYDYLKNSMGKGVDYGTTGNGLGNFREVNGSFSVSRNPKWYQDFYKTNGRKPTNAELMQLAEDHVKNGFADETGNLPSFVPSRIQDINDQIDEISTMIQHAPDQETQLKPILQALEEDKAAAEAEYKKAIDGLANAPKVEAPVPKPNKAVTVPQPKVKEPAKVLEPLKQPNLPPKKPNERSFFTTVQNPDKLSPELQQKLAEFDKSYKPMSNKDLVDYANEYVSNDMEKAYQFVKNAGKLDPRHITVGHRLIDELQKAGDYNRALDVVERLAEHGTKAGQSIQSYSIYNRLTAEGQLLRAQRHVNRINANIADPAKQVKLTEQNIQDITQAADSIKKMTGQQEQANNVMKIMENMKKGNVATDTELDTVRSFVADAKKFIGDVDPKAPTPKVKTPKDVRTRDKVVDFMNKKEDVARQELKKILGRANSLPVDAFYHLATIGASKIAKGTVKLADFTEEMVKEFGEVVRPYAKQIYNKAVETFNLQSESMTRQRLSEVEKLTNKALKDKNLDPDQAESIKEFARKVSEMSGDIRLEHSMELQSVLQGLDRPTFGQKLSAAQTIAQLLNPKTIVRNALGNEIFYRVEQMNKILATPIDMARSKITGGERTIAFTTHGQNQYWKNWFTGAKAGWKGVNPMGLTTAYDLHGSSFRSKFNPLTYLEKAMGATLRSFDYAGYMRAYNNTLSEMASLRAINEGLKGTARKEAMLRYMREADENMKQIADEYGRYATFQDDTALSSALSKVKRGMNKVSTAGMTDKFGLGDMVLKYPKTPGNLIMRAIEYSPAGFLRSIQIAKDALKTKDPFKTRDFYLSFSRAIMGTAGFSLLGYYLADKGILTSSGTSDYDVANLEKNAGKQANSVNVSALQRFFASGFKDGGIKPGDQFISYDWAQPISMAIALGTGVNQSQKDNGKTNAIDAAKGAFDSATNTIISQSVLQGLNNFLTTAPGTTTSDRFANAAKGVPGSFIPTLSNQIRQVGDNTSRSIYSPDFKTEVQNRTINRIPSLEKNLPAGYDTLGNKKENFQNGGNNLLNVFLNPSFTSKYQPTPEEKFLIDTIQQTGDKTLAPRTAPKQIDGIKLDGKQYAEMQQIMGQETQKGLKGLLPKLQNANSEDVQKSVSQVLDDAGKKARIQIRLELLTPQDLQAASQNGVGKELVISRIQKGMTIGKAIQKARR